MAHYTCYLLQDEEPSAEQARSSGTADSGNAELDAQIENMLDQKSA